MLRLILSNIAEIAGGSLLVWRENMHEVYMLKLPALTEQNVINRMYRMKNIAGAVQNIINALDTDGAEVKVLVEGENTLTLY